jgi:hypothetical protein
LPPGKVIETPGLESYQRSAAGDPYKGYNRVRLDAGQGAGDAAILAQFDDVDPASPAGYRNLIDLQEKRYRDTMQIEVIAEVTTGVGPEQVVRILRMTADQAPFDNVNARGQAIASGKFFFRGVNQVWATVDGGAMQSGVGDLENLIIDFDSESASIDLRTPLNTATGSEIETQLTASGLPFNVRTGAFGGAITLQTRSGVTGEIITEAGVLRGNINGDEAGLSRLIENMTASGLYTVSGDRLKASGVFYGSQLNYAD